MLIDFRPHNRLRAERPADLGASVLPVVTALSESKTDLSKVRVVCDWVQYRNNFRDVVEIRPILRSASSGAEPGSNGTHSGDMEIAVDVRRAPDTPLNEVTTSLLRRDADRVFLEDWTAGSHSCIWRFNALYWSALELWEKATGRGYEQALPGGESDARNRAAAADLIGELMAVWDRLGRANALPDELYIIELGVGNGNQAKVFLDEFRELDRRHGKGYYERLHYLMCDYSAHVLDLARETVADHTERVSSFALDATKPRTALSFLRDKVFLVYVSNVYDNLPTDEVAQLGGRTYQVQTRAYVPDEHAGELADSVSATIAQLPCLVDKLLRLGPSLLVDACPAHFPDLDTAVHFWQSTWSALRLEERYVPLDGLDTYQITDALTGEALRPLLELGTDVRMHVNNGAVASFDDTLALLHPYGKLVCHDLFVTDIQGYHTTFRGPGKYDGSVVNWVNGPLLAHVGRRRGFDVHHEPFRHRGGGNIVTMTAQARD
ncbi:MAG TPA: SAM-dependent methyltransferase [Mycobacterium sp.]|nr:SAM-dependent methyltransferase [Mycobacterium sp.]